MALSGRPKKSLYQVGDTVFFLNGTRGDSSEIVKVISKVTDPQDDNTALQENIYFIKGFVKDADEHNNNSISHQIKVYRSCSLKLAFHMQCLRKQLPSMYPIKLFGILLHPAKLRGYFSS